MSKELLDFMTWVNQDKGLGYTTVGIERIVNTYTNQKEKLKSMNTLDKQYTALLQDSPSIQETVTRFINKGVYQTKIITTELPSVVIWSKTRKCLVGGKDQPDSFEVVDDGNGNLKATCDNNVFVTLLNRSELTESDVKEINESEGIIVTNATYGKPYFRFEFIPK